MNRRSAPTAHQYQLEGFRFESGVAWPSQNAMHQHQDVEILLLLNTSAAAVRWRANGVVQRLPLDLNHLCVVPMDQWHGVDWLQPTEYIRLFLHPIRFGSMLHESRSDVIQLVGQYGIQDARIRALIMTLQSSLHGETVPESLYLDSLIHRLMMHVVNRYASLHPSSSNAQPITYAPWLRDVLDYIHDSLDQDLRLTQLAAIARMDETQFFDAFTEALDLSPFRYLLHERIARVKELIYPGSRSLSEVARRCGFQHHQHLRQRFWQVTGQTLPPDIE